MRKVICVLLAAVLVLPNFALARNIEDTVTRAEFAMMINRMRRLEDYATPQDTWFIDVTAEHWASGYIAVASGIDVVRGHGDGTFKPDNAVTYQQVIAMVMRALGYAPMVVLYGGFPNGYLYAAIQMGVIDSVDFELEQNITRGDIAIIINRASDIPLMERTGWGHRAWRIMDGTDGSPLRTFRTDVWDNTPVYFDGWEFVIMERED